MTLDEYTYCICCNAILIDFVPERCCSGIDCGCLGLPIDPPVCSIECEQKLMDQV